MDEIKAIVVFDNGIYQTKIEGDGTSFKRSSINTVKGTERVRIPEDRNYKTISKSSITSTKLTITQVNYFESSQSIVDVKDTKTKANWKRMKSADRLRYHIEQIAEGRPFTITFLD